MYRVFIALALACPIGSCTMAVPPPPSHSSDLKPEEALAAVIAWDGFAPLTGWNPTVERLEALPGTPPASAIDIRLETPTKAAPSGKRYAAKVRLVVDAYTGTPRDNQRPGVRRTAKFLEVLPAAERDPTMADFAARHPEAVRSVGHDGRQGDIPCVELDLPGATIGWLQWCAGKGIAVFDGEPAELKALVGFEGLAAQLATALEGMTPVSYRVTLRSDDAWLVQARAAKRPTVKRVARRIGPGWQVSALR